MAELSEAFNGIKFETKNFQQIDYFFTQRNLKEDREFLDKNMNRTNKQVSMIYNFLALSIPQHELKDDTTSTIEADIFGENGYHYKGQITSYKGSTPNFLIPLKDDKKLFIHLIYKESNKETEFKDYVCFIEVPKRFQSVDNSTNKLRNETETTDI
jgi:sRNA-binding regulator protein Hfq